MPEGQLALPVIPGLALVVGPVFLCFELEGDPGHKARHRARIAGKFGHQFVHMYADPKTAAYEKTLAQAAALFMRGKQPTLKPVAVLVHAFRRIPQSWSERDREAALAGVILPTARPDIDNNIKLIDSLNGIVWHDDAQVVDVRGIKRFSAHPALRIEVREFIAP